MKAKLIFPALFLFLLVPTVLSAQTVPTQGHIMGYVIEDGDTLFVSSIPLCTSSAETKEKDKEWREYYQTVHNFARHILTHFRPGSGLTEQTVFEYPFVFSTGTGALPGKTERELFAEFEAPAKTDFSQGRILLRSLTELGMTSFGIVRVTEAG